MAKWLIRVIGKRRSEVDKDLLVQAVLALGRQLAAQKRLPRSPTTKTGDATPKEGAAA